MIGFDRVVEILDKSVGGEQVPISVHGAFWRNTSRDAFIALNIFGQQLIVLGNGAESGLVKALNGEAPFGSDQGVPSAGFRRMPAGMAAVAEHEIQEISAWIDAGCPQYASENEPSPTPGNLKKIIAMRIFPPLVIARMGSSPNPLEAYSLAAPETPGGFRQVVPEATIYLNNGEVEKITKPAQIHFKDIDQNGIERVRPVAPFLEAWVQFEGEDEFVPLKKDHMQSTEDLSWQLVLGNWKVYRRTGEEQDKIKADSGFFKHHEAVNLNGESEHFLANKTIPMGVAQYIRPTDAFPEIRLRFTPPHGKVYGHQLDQNVITEDTQVVYDARRGKWDSYPELDPNNDPSDVNWPASTIPGGIYAQRQVNGRPDGNLGYLDDSSDGIITLRLNLPGQASNIQAQARIAVGPPDFSPDSLHVRTLQDDLLQALNGVQPAAEEITAVAVLDIVQRAVDTVRLMYPPAVNQNYAGTTGRPPTYTASISYPMALSAHQRLLESLAGLTQSPQSDAFKQGLERLSYLLSRLREYTQVADSSITGRVRMPAMMRGSDGLDLALTQRQLNILQTFYNNHKDVLEPAGGIPPIDEKAAMLALIEWFNLNGASAFHQHIVNPNGGTLAHLFAAPEALIEYLLTATAGTGSHQGQPLVLPGRPSESAFISMLEGGNPLMTARFNEYREADSHRNGVEVVRAWIQSLTDNS